MKQRAIGGVPIKTLNWNENTSCTEIMNAAKHEDVALCRDGHAVALVVPFDDDDLDWYAITLDQPLPGVPVPLLPGDADVILDLQRALTTIYDQLRFDLAMDYSHPPEVPLPPQTAAWVDEHLRAHR
jgi:hypothetical protein